jgi:murein DD-endopeptidase MepM/ murein hydrolase activator NlpD
MKAPMGAPVRAAADGRIVKFFDSERGGLTIYQFDTSERFVYYYAHLGRRAPSLAEGDVVHQGDVIAYVGMSGNAPVPHLHFEIQRLTSQRHWWEADSINPYPLLRDGRAPH